MCVCDIHFYIQLDEVKAGGEGRGLSGIKIIYMSVHPGVLSKHALLFILQLNFVCWCIITRLEAAQKIWKTYLPVEVILKG